MFQRYEIVIDYDQRLRLPPPLTIISYIIMLFQWLFKRSEKPKYDFTKRRKPIIEESTSSSFLDPNNRMNGSGGGSTDKDTGGGSSYKVVDNMRKLSTISSNLLCSKKQIDHSLYWKEIVQDYAKNLDDSAREKDIHKEQAIG
jgi:hypothetical protein